MAYQITIRNEVEKAQHKARPEQDGMPCADAARYRAAHRVEGFFGGTNYPAVLEINFRRPEGNLVSQREWIEMLAQCVKGCRRYGSEERGLSQAEFQELAQRSERQDANNSVNGWKITMARGYQRGIKAAELKSLRRLLGW